MYDTILFGGHGVIRAAALLVRFANYHWLSIPGFKRKVGSMKLRLIVGTARLFTAGLFVLAPGVRGDTNDAKRPWTVLGYGAVDNSADDPFVNFIDKVRRAIDNDPGSPSLLVAS